MKRWIPFLVVVIALIGAGRNFTRSSTGKEIPTTHVVSLEPDRFPALVRSLDRLTHIPLVYLSEDGPQPGLAESWTIQTTFELEIDAAGILPDGSKYSAENLTGYLTKVGKTTQHPVIKGIEVLEPASDNPGRLVVVTNAQVSEPGKFFHNIAPGVIRGIPEDGEVQTRVIFTLRENLTAPTGGKLTTAHLRNPLSRYAGLRNRIGTVRYPDDRTIVVDDANIGAAFWLAWADPGIVPEHRAAADPDANTTLQATGPMAQFIESDNNPSTVLLTENPAYGGPPASEDALQWKPGMQIQSESVQVEEVLRGEVSRIDHGFIWLAQAPKHRSIATSRLPVDGARTWKPDEVVWIRWNQLTDVMKDVRVRQALHFGVRRRPGQGTDSGILEYRLGAAGTPAFGFRRSDTPPGRAYNPVLANELLDGAGWTDSDGDGWRDKDRVNLRLIIQTPFQSTELERAVLYQVRTDFARLGIDVQSVPAEVEDIAGVLETISTTPDAPWVLRFGSEFPIQSYGTADPRVDAIFENAPYGWADVRTMNRLEQWAMEAQPGLFLAFPTYQIIGEGR